VLLHLGLESGDDQVVNINVDDEPIIASALGVDAMLMAAPLETK
jgi:hypothetical protein